MRPVVLYPVGTVAVVALTVLLFTVDLPGALSAAVQVAWVVLVAALCWTGARDIGRRLEAEGRLPARRRRGVLRPAPRADEPGDAGAPDAAAAGAAAPGGPARADDPVLQMLDALTPDEERRRRPE